MRASVRVMFLVLAILLLALGLGFYAQLSWVTHLWPWPDSYLSYVFLSSYAIAIGGGVLWVALCGSLGAARGGAINLAVATGGISIYLWQLAQGDSAVQAFALFCTVSLLGIVVLYYLIRRAPIRDQRRTPLLVRVSFLIFTALLIYTAISLLLKSPTIFPWALRQESSVIFGWAFLGAACYFLYGVFYPRWDNAGGQLLGFLGYDLILIIPFLRHFADVPADHALSLVIYVAVIAYSGLLAIYYLCIHRYTRRWTLERQAPQGAAVGARSQTA